MPFKSFSGFLLSRIVYAIRWAFVAAFYIAVAFGLLLIWLMQRPVCWLISAAVFLAVPVSAMAQTAIVAPAGATAAVPGPDGTTVFLYPLINGLMPFIVSGLGALITALVAIAVGYLRAHYKINVTAAQEAKFDALLKTEAGVYIAKGDVAVMNAQIDVGSPGIAAAANAAIAAAPAVAKALGVTQAGVETKIVGEIGKLQALAPPPDTPAAPLQLHPQ